MSRFRGTRTAPAVGHYGDLASEYDQRWSSYVESSLDLTLARVAPKQGDQVLDIGCGTGRLLERLCAEHPSVGAYGCDPTPQMLEVAHRRRLVDRAHLVLGAAEALPFGRASFDWVISSSVLHYIADPIRAVEEAVRVLRPGGHIVLTDWCHDFVAMKLLDAYLKLTHAAHIQTHSTEDLVGFMEAAGLQSIRIERKRTSRLWGLMLATGKR